MVTATPDRSIRQGFHPSFFFWMTVAMAACIFSGFTLTYWQPMMAGTMVPLPPIVHLHGAFYFAWIVLLMLQASLIGRGSLALHRSIGTFGITIATGVLVTGLLLTLMFGRVSPPDTTPSYYDFMFLGFTAILGFGLLFTLAIRNVRKPGNHKRLILLATIPLLPPGINRLYQVTLGLVDAPVLATYMTMDVLLAAILIYDWRTLGKASRVSVLGAVVILGVQLAHGPIVTSAVFADFCSWISSAAYYR
jgi:hypothetical protein